MDVPLSTLSGRIRKVGKEVVAWYLQVHLYTAP